VTLLDCLDDPQLLGAAFGGTSWSAWRVFLQAIEGRPLAGEALALFQRATGRSRPPTTPVSEVVAICGRRAGKSRMAALLAVEAATLKDWAAFLAPGEVATIAVVSADRPQSRTTFGYICGILDAVPLLGQLVTRRRAHAIELGRVRIEVTTASARTSRGYSFALVVADELAFWKSETTTEPDREVLDAIRPGLTTLGGRLVCISSPHAKSGALWDAFRRAYGQDDAATLVWKLDTATMNPSIDPAVIAAAYEADPVVAASEYGAEFRDDLAPYLDRERLEALVVRGRTVVPPLPEREYHAFVDMSGGQHDSAAVCVAHVEGALVVVDLVAEERAPHNPETVARTFGAVLKSYHCDVVSGDRYAAAWVSERFAAEGVRYAPAEATKSEFYARFVPLVMAGRVALPDDRVVVTQLAGLERRVVRGTGKENIDHRVGARDDVANVVAAVAVLAAAQGTGGDEVFAANLADAPRQRLLDYRELQLMARDFDIGGW
jgi:hypothetical protein